ncbi:MAG: sulfite oxidase [Caldilineaceae bacterium]
MSSLIPVSNRPFNAETPLEVLPQPLTPTELFYVRNHFDVPEMDTEGYRLDVSGTVGAPLSLSLAQIQALPSRTLTSIMECAGNGRIFMEPKPAGTPWELGAVSVATWTGTPLAEVLKLAGVQDDAVDVLFVGADSGTVEGKTIQYERSLPLNLAQDPDVLLVWAMNGEPLTPNHGAPLRVLVPGWYGMAAVKWLQSIQVLPHAFDGYYQTYHYVYWDDDHASDGEPIREMQVRAMICAPAAGDEVTGDVVEVSGVAWSGFGPVIAGSVHGRGHVEDAELDPLAERTMQEWRYRWTPSAPGEYSLRACATDAAGNTQPLRHRSNRLGYGNNAVHELSLTVTG